MKAGRLGKEAASALVRWSGCPPVARRTVARSKVAILLYHDPRVEVLGRHLRYLAPRYTFISLSTLVDALHRRDWTDIPPRSVVFTFDDGHRGNAELLPLFRRYGVVPTIYLCSQIVATRRHFWFAEVPDSSAWKRLPNAERLAGLKAETGFDILREYDEETRQALSAAEVESMNDVVEFGAHTRFHPVLTTCEPPERAYEVVQSKPEIEALTSKTCAHFSYPNGDFGAADVAYVKEAGYSSARSIEWGWNGIDADPFGLRILGVPDDASVNRLAADLSGVTGWLGAVARRRFPGRRPVAGPVA